MAPALRISPNELESCGRLVNPSSVSLTDLATLPVKRKLPPLPQGEVTKLKDDFKKLYIQREVPDVATQSIEHLAEQQSSGSGQHVPGDSADGDARFVMSSSSIGLETIGIPKQYVRQGGRGGKGPQNISGDLISKVPEVVNRDIGDNKAIQQELEEDDNRTSEEEDNVSVTSSIGSDIVGVADENVRTRRRRRTRLDILGEADDNLQRLRPRNRE